MCVYPSFMLGAPPTGDAARATSSRELSAYPVQTQCMHQTPSRVCTHLLKMPWCTQPAGMTHCTQDSCGLQAHTCPQQAHLFIASSPAHSKLPYLNFTQYVPTFTDHSKRPHLHCSWQAPALAQTSHSRHPHLGCSQQAPAPSLLTGSSRTRAAHSKLQCLDRSRQAPAS